MVIFITVAIAGFCLFVCSKPEEMTSVTEYENTEEAEEMENTVKIVITSGNNRATAVLDDNSTTRAFIKKLPLTLTMMDLYGRELCYRFDEELPTDNLRYDGYDIGDIAYWPPGHSFVILYEQNGEVFERQHLGHIENGIEMFDGIGDTEVTFELAN